jgi:hypothetical protein
MSATQPHRACRFTLDIESDTRGDMVTALENIARQLDRGEMTKGVSGGYSSGYIYEYTESESPTHAEYIAELNAHLGRKAA